jgi:hypothetical protein
VLWALLAKVLLRQPPATQALALGLSSGLFVAAAAEANQRDPSIESTALLVLVAGTIAGALYYAGLMRQRKAGWEPGRSDPRWLYALYAVVWAVGLLAALLALFGEGGLKVAVLAIVPLVLLAPTALNGARSILRR